MKDYATNRYFQGTKLGAMRENIDDTICSHGNKKEECTKCNKEDKLATN